MFDLQVLALASDMAGIASFKRRRDRSSSTYPHMGSANGHLRGNLHRKAPEGTRMANVMLGLMRGIGMEELESFGDSTGEFCLRTALP